MKIVLGVISVFLFVSLMTLPGTGLSSLIGESNFSLTVTVIDPNAPPPPPPPPGGGGGGGGGGGAVDNTLPTEVIFKGIAYPGRIVVLMSDGQVIAKVPAGPDALFEIHKAGIGTGAFNFSVWSEDINGIRSTTKSFSQWITAGVTTVISGIFLPPTISADKSEVRLGDEITFIGQTAPSAVVNMFVHSESELIKATSTDKNGVWIYRLDTIELEKGSHTSKARANKNSLISTFSDLVNFVVGDRNVTAGKRKKLIGDLNDDGFVNLIDFSIEAFWYKKTGFPPDFDLNGDNKIDLIDFSIMAYYWTG